MKSTFYQVARERKITINKKVQPNLSSTCPDYKIKVLDENGGRKYTNLYREVKTVGAANGKSLLTIDLFRIMLFSKVQLKEEEVEVRIMFPSYRYIFDFLF
jgi:hypothetical protein